MGWTVLNKTVKETYKSKRKQNTPEDRLIFKDAHPQIISEEMWNVVQRLRETRRRPERITGEPNPLTGVLYCPDCGGKMYHKKGKADNAHKPHHEYVCSSYRHYSRSCTCHYIRVPVIENLILDAIQRVSGYVRNNEAEFLERVREKSVLQQETAVKENRRKLTQSQRRREEVSVLIKSCMNHSRLIKSPKSILQNCLPDMTRSRTRLTARYLSYNPKSTASTPIRYARISLSNL